MKDTAFNIETWPAGIISRPPDPRLLKQFKRQGNFNINMPLPIMRGMVHLATFLMTPILYTGKFRSRYRLLEGNDRKTGIRIIRPDNDEILPAILYLHGGGGLLTDSSSYLRVMKNISESANAVVFGLDYSRGPEFPFPAGLEDAVAALEWLFKNANDYLADKRRISIAGDSAGGNLAAGLALLNRNNSQLPVYRQLLINAKLTHQQEFPSIHSFAEGYGLTRTAMRFFASRYFSNTVDTTNQYASPLEATNLQGLPPALIITSEYDPLRDEGEAYAGALARAGVQVKAVRFTGMAHTMVVFGTTKEAAAHCMKLIAEMVQ